MKEKKTEEKPKMGRPRKELEWDSFDGLCKLQCTLREIANWFDMSEDTVERRVQESFGITFAEYYDKKSADGKISIRRKQFQVAMSGCKTMLIFLGKQWLGQAEKIENKNEHSGGLSLEQFLKTTNNELEEKLKENK